VNRARGKEKEEVGIGEGERGGSGDRKKGEK
jgi:hypothetical protein